MAGWTKMRNDLPDDAKLNAIAERLRVPLTQAIGCCFVFWAWANQQAKGEAVDGLSLGWINAKVKQSGFAEALVAVGWLVKTDTGFRLPNFGEHNWKVGQEKALAADRQDRKRKRKSRNSHAGTVTTPVKKRDLPIPLPLNTPLPPFQGAPCPFPDPLNTEAFRAAWGRWCAYRAERKKKLTPSTVRAQLKTLAALGEPLAVRTIDHTIEKGWAGLFPPDDPPARKDEPAPDLFAPVPTAEDVMREYERSRKDAK